MAEWESWAHLHGLEHIHSYIPNTVLNISDKEGPHTKKFKEWRGIISHCVDKTSPNNKHYHCFIPHPEMFGDILVVSCHNDINAQIIVEPLAEWMKMARRIGKLDMMVDGWLKENAHTASV